ncbi:MAG TPA: ABC transporter permease [Bryobacteraceae bacterium]|nr:ABC transporter permease [Bryobacteraceae bacterium]
MSLLSRFVAVFRRERVNREIDEEQEFHIASLTDELLEAGMEPEEAARQARLQFGNRTRMKAESRDARLFGWLETTGQDLYYGVRTLRKSPGFATVAILTLAIGIGANTAIFSVVNGVLLNPLPYHNPERIVSLFEATSSYKNGPISYPNFLDWQRMNRTFSAIVAYRQAAFNLSGQGEPEHLEAEMISAGLFEILGVRPVMGRTFTKEDDRLGVTPTAMISEQLWRRKFGSSKDIIGQRLIVDGIGRTVVGIVPADFRLRLHNFQEGTFLNQVYVPIGNWNEPRFYGNRGGGWGMNAIGRLKPGVTLEKARSDMNRVSRQLAATYPDTASNEKANLIPLKKEVVGDIRPVLLLLLGAVGFVLLIACVNVANLLLARATSRQREFAIRLAIGAGQVRMVRQLLTESILLALIGGGLGLLLAKFGTAVAIAALPQTLPRSEGIGIDFHVLFFTIFISVATGVVFGLAPALKTSHADIAGDLKGTARCIARTRSRMQTVFVMTEIAMALVLLVGAGLMIRTLFALWNIDPGFSSTHVTSLFISPPPSLRTAPSTAIRTFLSRVHETVKATPGIEDASLSWGSGPMEGDSEWAFWFIGRPKPARRADLPLAITYIVEPDYFKALRIQLKRGRFLTDADDERSTAVALIDEKLTEKYFSGEDPIGRYLDLNAGSSGDDKMPNPKIVGVVRHVNQWGLDSDTAGMIQAQIYLPIAQLPDGIVNMAATGIGLYIRGKHSTPSFGVLRKRLLAINGETVAFGNEPLKEVVSATIAGKRFTMALLSVFAALALLLASIGIYGVLSYLVAQRTQEIGVRMALGAARWDVMRMILKDGARLAITGIGIGLAAALGLTRLMASMLFGVKPADVPTFALVSLLLAAVALLACYVPARRAMKIDPMTALRNE